MRVACASAHAYTDDACERRRQHHGSADGAGSATHRRKVVHDHVHAIVLLDPPREELGFLGGDRHLAKYFEVRLAHEEVVRRVLDHGAVEHLAEVLDLVLDLLRLAEGQSVVVVGQLRHRGCELHETARSGVSKDDEACVRGVPACIPC